LAFGSLVVFKATGAETNGQYWLAELSCNRGYGSPVHVHGNEDELFHILEGEMSIEVGGELYDAKPGSSVFLPRNIPHSYRAESDTVKALVLGTPAGYEGWISGGGGVEMFAGGAAAFRSAWAAAERVGRPRVVSLTYFALGPHAPDLADRYLSEYYGFAPPYAQLVLRGAAVGEARLKETLARLEAADCDEVLLTPCGDGLDQLKELQDVVFG
jgi:quercetin dioxygenase-like cupin family protein